MTCVYPYAIVAACNYGDHVPVDMLLPGLAALVRRPPRPKKLTTSSKSAWVTENDQDDPY